MLISIFLTSFFLAFSGAMMPGPLLSATIAKSSRHGIATGPLFILGHGILELLLLAFLLLGIAPLLQAPVFAAAISITGACIMGYMGISMFRELPGLSLQTIPEPRKYGPIVLTGAVLSISNPYWTIWWATIGLGLILIAMETGPLAVAIFFFGHILADLIWYTAVSICIWKGKRLLNDRVYRIIIGACAGIMMVFSLIFLVQGFTGYEL